ncbi:ABC transporter ATP-binding protein [Paenibacillus tarimensis]|uniref:ABC transporter ATP-binding protein n=1 Tax=Paenibacillus tarimensis TaxID=416012 RepID=UPI001F4558ED|nr:ABC transporter ATP-binding protein [Paenibacillus tarimensis]MCF2943276.1 ABC transporter ATP-binding protein [Paenibacillus tarimensis]
MIRTEQLTVKYRGHAVLDQINVLFEQGLVHSILGPNGCGKSTLLKTLSRQLKGESGAVYVDGKEVKDWGTKSFARHLAILSQVQERSIDIRVHDLVSYGRFPHKGWMQKLDDEDIKVVQNALELTGMASLANRNVQELSGGERQRARIAMAIAQQPKLLLLDEPTTYLDLCHQLEILELARHLNRVQKMTIVMVLHDLNHALSYSDRITVMKNGSIYSHGAPCEVVNEEMLREVFHVEACVEKLDVDGSLFIKSMKLLLDKRRLMG